MNVFTLIAATLTTYLVFCFIRVLLSWFGGVHQNPGLRILFTLTEPWLKVFSGLRFLHFRYLDLSPLVALIMLQFLIQVFWKLSYLGFITPGIVLGLFITLVASTINFFFLFFVILALVRFFGILLKAPSTHQFWYTLDHILQPVVYPLLSFISPKRIIPYGTGLFIFMALLFGFNFGLQKLLEYLSFLAYFIGSDNAP